MSGYDGWAMSNNAVAAYANGEMPISKWTKKQILASIREQGINCEMSKLQQLPVKVLRDICLRYSSWHHTSSHYNQTAFYSLDVDRIEGLTNTMLDNMITTSKASDERTVPEERWECAFLEWTGSKKHPKATELIETGVVKGMWFIREDGSKKKTTAKGFRFIKKLN